MKTIIEWRELVLDFAKSIPNVERVGFNNSKQLVEVFFDGVHSHTYTYERVKQWGYDKWRGYTPELIILGSDKPIKNGVFTYGGESA